jgi:deoxyribodipyrimidine photolyase
VITRRTAGDVTAPVATALADAQIDLRAKRGLLIHEPESLVTGAGAGYTVFGPFLRRWEALPMRDILPPPDKLPTRRGGCRRDA